MTPWEIFVNEFVTKQGYLTFLTGLKNTAIIAVFGLLIGIVIGTLIAVIKVVPKKNVFSKALEKIADIYVGFFRGTPMVVQLLIGYFILFPAMNIRIDAVFVAVAIFGMNSGAYVSEIMRSGLQSVDPGQTEAGRSLGMSYSATMIRVVLPQAIKNVVPTIGNEFISLLKETSIVSVIGLADLTRAFKAIADSTFEYFIPYIALALIYFVLVLIVTLIIKLLERRFAKSEKR